MSHHRVKKLSGAHVARMKGSNKAHIKAFKNTPSKVKLKKHAKRG